MKYYEDNLSTIYLGKFQDVCQTLSEKVDLVLTDPPYNVLDFEWDTDLNLNIFWETLKKVSHKDTVYAITATQPFTSKLVMSNLKNFKYEWIWDKYIARGFQYARFRPMNRHESILIFCEGNVRYNPQMIKRDKPVSAKNYSKKSGHHKMTDQTHPRKIYEYKNPDTIITGLFDNNQDKFHPTQKPSSLGAYLIKTYTNENDTVLDIFAGSHSFGVAAKEENRKSINIEMQESYCEIGKKRLQDARVNLIYGG